MQSAYRLSRGSRLASKVYRSLPRAEQVYALFKELKSLAVYALKEGRVGMEVLMLFRQRLGKAETPIAPSMARQKKTSAGRITLLFTKRLFSVRGGRREKVLGWRTGHFKLPEVLRE
jgi:hypothetical protein